MQINKNKQRPLESVPTPLIDHKYDNPPDFHYHQKVLNGAKLQTHHASPISTDSRFFHNHPRKVLKGNEFTDLALLRAMTTLAIYKKHRQKHASIPQTMDKSNITPFTTKVQNCLKR
jgi:hypothetical protein